MDAATCHEPTNGGGRCLRSDDIDALHLGMRSLNLAHAQLAEATAGQLSGLRSDVLRLHQKFDRLLEGIRIGSVHAEPATIVPPAPMVPAPIAPVIDLAQDWDLDEPTGQHEAPVWSSRAKELAVENAALRATLLERERVSDRAAKKQAEAAEITVKKWQIVAGVIVAVTGAAAGLAALIEALAG